MMVNDDTPEAVAAAIVRASPHKDEGAIWQPHEALDDDVKTAIAAREAQAQEVYLYQFGGGEGVAGPLEGIVAQGCPIAHLFPYERDLPSAPDEGARFRDAAQRLLAGESHRWTALRTATELIEHGTHVATYTRGGEVLVHDKDVYAGPSLLGRDCPPEHWEWPSYRAHKARMAVQRAEED